MPEIRAFVGHSFRQVDEGVVASILGVLDRVAQLRPHFSWDHAREPEPRTVDSKVLALFENKTLFIGICTRAERVIDDRLLGSMFGHRHAHEAAFEWKASDWLLQEIGLSLGRGLNIILLLEDGTREPGDLQGNWERIPFERSAPEKCFEPLLGMLAKLAGKGNSMSGGIAAEQPAQVDPPPSGTEKGSVAEVDLWQPDETWDMPTFQVGYRITLVRKGQAEADKIATAFGASKVATDATRATWATFLALTKLRGGEGTLADVVSHSENHPTNSAVSALVAQAYEHFSEAAEAAAWYERASDQQEDQAERIWLLGRAALTALQGGRDGLFARLLAKLRLVEVTKQATLTALLSAELSIAEERKDDDVAIACLEALLNLDPSDTDRRFSLAHRYNATSRSDMSALHYSKIPESSRGAAVWNNLGVAYEGLDFSIAAVDAYRKADEAGHTLATSNLAKRLLDAGFVREATDALETAIAKPMHDRLVDTRLAEAKDAREDEKKEREKILPKCRTTSDFFVEFGAARLAGQAVDISGEWETDSGTAVVVAEGEYFLATLEEPLLGLMGLAVAKQAGITIAGAQSRRFQISGSRLNRAINATSSSLDKSTSVRTLLERGSDPKVLIWAAPGGSELHFMERRYGEGNPTFYTWRRKGTHERASS